MRLQRPTAWVAGVALLVLVCLGACGSSGNDSKPAEPRKVDPVAQAAKDFCSGAGSYSSLSAKGVYTAADELCPRVLRTADKQAAKNGGIKQFEAGYEAGDEGACASPKDCSWADYRPASAAKKAAFADHVTTTWPLDDAHLLGVGYAICDQVHDLGDSFDAAGEGFASFNDVSADAGRELGSAAHTVLCPEL